MERDMSDALMISLGFAACALLSACSVLWRLRHRKHAGSKATRLSEKRTCTKRSAWICIDQLSSWITTFHSAIATASPWLQAGTYRPESLQTIPAWIELHHHGHSKNELGRVDRVGLQLPSLP